MATINKSLEYPFNLLDAINQSVIPPGDKFSFTKEQMLDVIDYATKYRLTERECKIIDFRYKEYHTCKEAGALLDTPISGGRFAQIEQRMLTKLRRYAATYQIGLDREEEKKTRITLERLKETTESVSVHWKARMPLMAAEEAGELIQAISKYERKLYAAANHEAIDSAAITFAFDHLIEEMGDVLIVIGALANHYGIGPEEIERAIRDKLSEERTI